MKLTPPPERECTSGSQSALKGSLTAPGGSIAARAAELLHTEPLPAPLPADIGAIPAAVNSCSDTCAAYEDDDDQGTPSMSKPCSTCGKVGGGGFFLEPTNFDDHPNGMQRIACPACWVRRRPFPCFEIFLALCIALDTVFIVHGKGTWATWLALTLCTVSLIGRLLLRRRS